MGRLILAILVAIVLGVVLSLASDYIMQSAGLLAPPGQPFFETGPLAIAFLYRALYTVMCSYIAAAIAREKAMKAVVTLGILQSVVWLLGAIAMWDKGPAWYNIGGVVVSFPLSLLGGKLRVSRQQRRPAMGDGSAAGA